MISTGDTLFIFSQGRSTFKVKSANYYKEIEGGNPIFGWVNSTLGWDGFNYVFLIADEDKLTRVGVAKSGSLKQNRSDVFEEQRKLKIIAKRSC